VAREQRRLAAIVAADVVGYSRLMGRDESGTVARLKQNRAERLDPIFAKYGGRLVKLTCPYRKLHPSWREGRVGVG
jgi:adenylate cyclase